MPIEELANILVQMCDNAEQDKEKSVMPHLFGIRYADEIGNRHTEIVTEANRLDERVKTVYAIEVYKGVRLAKYVIDRKLFIENTKNSFIKDKIKYISVLWSKLAIIQKIIFIGIILAVIVGFVALHTLPQIPLSPVIDAPIRDEAALDRIVLRINQEGVKTFVTPEGLVQVANETTARRMRAILIREDLIPMNIDPWAIFDRERWTITDFERNINFRRAQTWMITDHIKAIDDVDDANVVIVIPERELFRSDQNPVTASVMITPRPDSDITTNRKKIEGIQKILKLAIEGLRDENIVIIDQRGNMLNYFE